MKEEVIFKQTEIGSLPSEWGLGILRDLVDPGRSIRYGIVQPGKFDPNGRYMIRGQDYSKGWAAPADFFRVSPAVEEAFVNARVRSGDVLITIVGASTGRIAIVPPWLDGANLTQTTARIAVRADRVDNVFSALVLESPVGSRQVSNYLKGAAQPGLNCGDIEKFVIPVPPLNEQRAIAEALSDVDALLAALDRLIAKKRDLKQAAMQQLLTGQTRLPGFSGEWTLEALGRHAAFRTGPFGSALHKSDYMTDGIPVVNPMHIVNGRIEPSRTMTVTETAAQNLSDFRLRTGEIVISRRGDVGRCAVVQDEHAGWLCGTGSMIIRPQNVHPGFLQRALSSSPVVAAIEDASVGTTMVNLNQGTLAGLKIKFPPRAEQTAIAAVLSDMDAELDALERRGAKTTALKQGMTQELLTGRTRLV